MSSPNEQLLAGAQNKDAIAALVRLCVQIKKLILLPQKIGAENPRNTATFAAERDQLMRALHVFSEIASRASDDALDEIGRFLFEKVDNAIVQQFAALLHKEHLRSLGIANLMRISSAFNRLKYARHDAFRREQYTRNIDALLRENGAPTRPLTEVRDGWFIDTSMSLPFLKEVLEDGDKIIEARGGVKKKKPGNFRSHFQNIWQDEDAEKYPSFLDFALSSDILGVAAHYLKTIPVLSSTLPPGVRIIESNKAYDDTPDTLHDSQLFHIDYYARTNLYVLVLLRDCTIESGPFSFLPKSISERVAPAVNNWGAGVPYHLSDDLIYSVADRKDVVEFAYPRGSVLFFESSGCFHYGSRNCINSRFQLMLAYTSICRTDISELYLKHQVFKTKPNDSKLRRMVLDRTFLET